MVAGIVGYHSPCLQFLEGMSQKIMKGIEEAQKDIHKEKQKKDEEVCMCLALLYTSLVASATAARLPAQYPSGGLSLGLAGSPHARGKNIQPLTGWVSHTYTHF